MSKKVIVPIGKCTELMSDIAGSSKIDKVAYNSITITEEEASSTSVYTFANYGYDTNTSSTTLRLCEPTGFSTDSYEYKTQIKQGTHAQFGTIYWIYSAIRTKKVIPAEDLVYLELYSVQGIINILYKDSVRGFYRIEDYDNLQVLFNEVDSEELEYYWNNHLDEISTDTAGSKRGRVYTMTKNPDGSMTVEIIYLYWRGWELNPEPSTSFSGTATIYLNLQLSVVFKHKIEAQEKVEFGDGTNSYSLVDNSLMNTNTKYNDEIISLYNAKAILNNYYTNRLSIEATLIMANYYNEQGELVIDKSKGDIINVGDLVKFESNRYSTFTNKWFKITSSEFAYNGVPLVNLKAKEYGRERDFQVILVNPSYMVVDYKYNRVDGTQAIGTIEETTLFDDITYNDDITISANPAPMTDDYYYEVDNHGGDYDNTTKSLTITGTRYPIITIHGQTIARGTNLTLANSTAFSGYTGQLLFTGIIYANYETLGRQYIVGSASGEGTLTLSYSSYYGGWLIRLEDIPYDEDDYTLGYCEIIINSSGVRETWSTNEYNVYRILNYYIKGYFKKV